VKQVTTYVGWTRTEGSLYGDAGRGRPDPVTWQLPNEPSVVRRLVRRLERDAPGPVRVCYGSRAVRLTPCNARWPRRRELPGDRAVAVIPAQTR